MTNSSPTPGTKVFQGKIFSVWQWEQELFDGSTATYERITRPNTAYMVPVLPDKQILLVRDEQPQREPVITLPRGMVEEGEDPEVAAKRECLEETGYSATTTKLWHAYEPHGKISWDVFFYIGQGMRKQQEPASEPGERITLMPVSFDDFISLAAEGNLQDRALQILILQAKLDPMKMNALKTLLYE